MKTFDLPKNYKPYIDKYFLRAKEILEKDNLNPMAKVQVFIRRGDCKAYGIDEAIAILCKYSDIEKTGHIYSLMEGSYFAPGGIIMTIEAPIQSIIDLETMYLGVLSAETTLENDNVPVNLTAVEKRMREIVELVKPRNVSYFGARHWRYDADRSIAKACFDGGAVSCSTDRGADEIDKEGIGTIPHSLEAIYHWKTDLNSAVVGATMAFNKYMPQAIPRIALIDYANREILDSLKVAPMVNGIRIDTCGENYMQGIYDIYSEINEVGRIPYPNHWLNKGVSIYGVSLIRRLLNDEGYKDVKIILSSGFANPFKVEAYVEAEKHLGMKLFDSLGVGGVFISRMATADIISVGGEEIHKVGRVPKPTDELKKVF